MSDLPLLFTAAGPIPTPPATLRQALITLVAATNPGYTANLPGSLIDDISGTDVGALTAIDQARVDAVNAVSPYAANPYILAQLGEQFGIPQGADANASVFEVFSGSPGYVIPPGFTVGDGTNSYVIQDGGTLDSMGTSQPLFAVCTQPGTFAIPPNTVTTVITSVPSPYTITVTNPLAGVPSEAAQTIESYRAQLLDAYKVSTTGMPTYLKTLLNAVPGVSSRLISVRQVDTKYEVICGGGDPFQVAGAIYAGVSYIGLLTGSSIGARNVEVTIFDAPDAYNIIYVNPPQQVVTVAVTWNTTLQNFTASEAVNQFIIQAVQSYNNSIIVGQPINLLVMTEAIQTAIAPVLAPVNLTKLLFAVTINGGSVSPLPNTSIIPSDPEGYFFCGPTDVSSVQG